jgi:hypothetical protein
MGKNGILAVQSLAVAANKPEALLEFVEIVLAHPGSRTRQYFADEQKILCDGTVTFGPVSFMRIFKAGSTVPMLVKLGAKKAELEVYGYIVAKSAKETSLRGLVPCEVIYFLLASTLLNSALGVSSSGCRSASRTLRSNAELHLLSERPAS